MFSVYRNIIFCDMEGDPGKRFQHADGFLLGGYIISKRVIAQGFVAVFCGDPFHRLYYMRVGSDNDISPGFGHGLSPLFLIT